MGSDQITLQTILDGQTKMFAMIKDLQIGQDELSTRLTKVEATIIGVDRRLVKVEASIINIDKRLNRVEEKIDKLDQRLSNLEGSVERLELRFSGLEARSLSLEVKINTLSEQIKELRDYSEVGFNVFNARFDRVEERVDELEICFGEIAYKL